MGCSLTPLAGNSSPSSHPSNIFSWVVPRVFCLWQTQEVQSQQKNVAKRAKILKNVVTFECDTCGCSMHLTTACTELNYVGLDSHQGLRNLALYRLLPDALSSCRLHIQKWLCNHCVREKKSEQIENLVLFLGKREAKQN